MKQHQTALTREQILLRAAYQILKKTTEGVYVLDVLGVNTVWDEATCDGYCLMEEINDLLQDNDIDVDYLGEVNE